MSDTTRSTRRVCAPSPPLLLTALLLGGIFAGTAAAQVRAGSPAADPADAREHQYLTGARQLTFSGERSGEAYFSPDGSKAIFQSVQDGSPHYQIFTIDLRTSDAQMQLVSTGNGKTTCSYFHPQKPRILFASTHLDESTWGPDPEDNSPKRGYTWDMAKSMDIWEADLDGGNLTRISTEDGYDAECAYSPDGKSIVFTSNITEDPEIWIMNADGTDRRQLTSAPGYDGGPFFAPDGKSIIFRGFRGDGRTCQVFTIGIDGQNERQITSSEAINWCPYFHPSGEYIIYSSNVGRYHNFELFLMRADGTGITRLTFSAGADVLPSFSPDGKQVLWTSTRVGGKSQVYIADFWMPTDEDLGDDDETLGADAVDQEAYSKAYPSKSRHGGGEEREGQGDDERHGDGEGESHKEREGREGRHEDEGGERHR